MQPYIEEVTIHNVTTIKFDKLLEHIGEIALELLPEGGLNDSNRLHQIDVSLGRFANLYSYLIHLYAFVSYQAERQANISKDGIWKDLLRRKDALYEIAQAVKGKRESASRMLGVYEKNNEFIPDRRPNRDPVVTSPTAVESAKKSGWKSL